MEAYAAENGIEIVAQETIDVPTRVRRAAR